jgi:hypothetical protein
MAILFEFIATVLALELLFFFRDHSAMFIMLSCSMRGKGAVLIEYFATVLTFVFFLALV